MRPNQQAESRTPLTYTEPTERRNRANSHFCEVVGSTLFCLKQDCKYCDTSKEKNGDREE